MDVFSNNKARLILFLLDVCFQHLGLGIQDKYPPLVGYNLHFPMVLCFVWVVYLFLWRRAYCQLRKISDLLRIIGIGSCPYFIVLRHSL